MAGKSKKQQTIAGMNDDKNEALKHALKAMEDQFGPGTIMRLGDQTKLEVETIPTGFHRSRSRPRRWRSAKGAHHRDLWAGILR